MGSAVIALACGAMACATARVPPRATPPAATPAKVAYDVREAPAPRGLVLATRIARPAATQTALAAFVGGTVPMLGAMTAERLASVAFGDGIADVLDLEKPVDVVVLSRGASFDVVASMAVASFEDATRDLALAYRLAPPDADGVVVLDPLRPPTGRALTACALVPAAGAPDHRVVCATTEAARKAGGPYLARTVARWSDTEDVHVEAFTHAFMLGAAAAESSLADAGSDEWARRGNDWARESLLDTSRITLDASATAEAAHVVFGQVLAKDDSVISRVDLALARGARPLPDTFWRLPVDADVAFYSTGVSREEYGPLRADFMKMLRAHAETGAADSTTTDRALGLVDRMILTGGPLLFARGFDTEAAQAAVDGAAPRTASQLGTEADALARWYLAAVDEPSERWTEAAHELVAIQAQMRKTAKRGEGPTRSLTVAPIPDEAHLPPGALHLLATTAAAAPTKRSAGSKRDGDRPPFTEVFHAFIVPDEGRTWLAFGSSEARLLAKMHTVLDAAGGAGTLRARAGLEALRGATAGVAGFVTVAPFVAAKVPTAPPFGGDRFAARQWLDRVHDLDAHGATPIPFVIGGKAAAHDGVVTARVDVTRAALAQIFAATTR